MAAHLGIEASKRKRAALRPPPTQQPPKAKRGRPTKREQRRREQFKVETRREGDVEVLDIVTGPGWSKSMGRMIAASPIFFAQEVLTGSPEPPYNGRYLVGEHHIEWDQLVTQNQRVCVLAPRDHGKCTIRGSSIIRKDGVPILIEDWLGGELWAYDPQTHQLVPTFAPASRPNGVKPVLRVQTRSGRVVTVTHNHPLRLLNRWCRADELEVGQRIAVSYETPMPCKCLPINRAWLAGVVMGSGCCAQTGLKVTTADPILVEVLQSQEDVRLDREYEYRILGLNDWAQSLGFDQMRSHTMRVPCVLYQADKESLGCFLGGYLDTNAHINQHGGGAIEFYSVSEKLLRDVQHLLTRLGVLAVLSPKYGDGFKGPGYKSWRLAIRGKDILRFAKYVRPRGKRAAQLQDLVRRQEAKDRCSGPALDRFPKAVWGLVQHSGDWFRKRGLPRPVKGYEPTREKLRMIAEGEDNAKLKALVDAPVLWDEIVAIDDAGEQETWSIHVPGYENYLADDVINHNTFFFDFAYPIWKAVTMPGGIGFLFSATKDQAKLILEDIKTELETNPKLQHLVPSRKNKWRSDAIRLTNGHTIYARGYGTKVRGRHPHYIVCDDILNDETAYSEVVRQKEKDYFFTAVTNMITPKGQIVVIGTPFHKQDLYADLKKNPLYVYRQYQALGENNRVLWPERYSRKRLKARREEIGPIRFSREFQCDPVSDDMSLFPGGLFRGETVEQYTVKLGERLEFWRELGVTPYMGVDIAMSTTVKADYFVIWVMGPDARGNRWIIDIIRERGLGFQTQLSMIVEAARKYDPAMIFIEANQMQRVWGDELIRTSDLPIKKFTTTAQEKHALDKGVPGLRVLLENAKFRIPRGDARSVELTNIWCEEMRSFTWHDGKLQSVGGHDDTVMGCWICNQAITQGGFSFSFGEGDEETSMQEMLAELTGANDERTDEDDYPDNSLIDTDHVPNVLGLGSIIGVV